MNPTISKFKSWQATTERLALSLLDATGGESPYKSSVVVLKFFNDLETQLDSYDQMMVMDMAEYLLDQR